MPMLEMKHDKDPKEEILEKLGDISGVEIFNNQILVTTYIRPKSTKSGIVMTDNTRKEDEYQSKVALIVKMGPSAFDDPTGVWFEGAKFEVGDWIVFRPSDGWAMNIHGVPCRILDDTAVRVRVDNPDRIY